MPTFYVTEAAGETVAGGKSPGADKALELTEAQAEHPLRLGHIRREPLERLTRQTATSAHMSIPARRKRRGGY